MRYIMILTAVTTTLVGCITQSTPLGEASDDDAQLGTLGDGAVDGGAIDFGGDPPGDGAPAPVDARPRAPEADTEPRPEPDAEPAPEPDPEPPCAAPVLTESGRLPVADSDGRTWHVFVRDDIAFVTHTRGLTTLDVSQPERPRVLGTHRRGIPEGAFQIAPGADVGILAVVGDGIRAIDVREPALPREVGAFDLVGAAGAEYARDVRVIGDRAYVAALAMGFWVIDLSRPNLPGPVGSCCGEGARARHPLAGASGVHVLATRALATDTEVGLREIALDGDRPAAVGLTPLPGTGRTVVADETRAFVGLDEAQLVTVDVSQPGRAIVERVFPMPGPVRHLDSASGHLAVAAGPGGLLVLDPDDPRDPIAAAPAASDTTAVEMADERIYATDGIELRIFEWGCPE